MAPNNFWSELWCHLPVEPSVSGGINYFDQGFEVTHSVAAHPCYDSVSLYFPDFFFKGFPDWPTTAR
jgi:hypothetical protein